ncbi:MAG: hypothetical protein UR29_C0002G0001, partial [Candidatus Woesebacteria bacterium GW2011_GWC2_33_12]
MPPTFQEKSDQVDKIKLTFDQWKAQEKNVHDLGCETCQFIGGEPFLYRGEKGETVLDLAEYAKELGFKFIEIFIVSAVELPPGQRETDAVQQLDAALEHGRAVQTIGGHERPVLLADVAHELRLGVQETALRVESRGDDRGTVVASHG